MFLGIGVQSATLLRGKLCYSQQLVNDDNMTTIKILVMLCLAVSNQISIRGFLEVSTEQ